MIKCPKCGWTGEVPAWPLVCRCGAKYIDASLTEAVTVPVAKRGLGDAVASSLESLGITPASYARAKESLGLPPDCDCERRKLWLNRAGEWWRGQK